jgi:hypothetical protein
MIRQANRANERAIFNLFGTPCPVCGARIGSVTGGTTHKRRVSSNGTVYVETTHRSLTAQPCHHDIARLIYRNLTPISTRHGA